MKEGSRMGTLMMVQTLNIIVLIIHTEEGLKKVKSQVLAYYNKN